MAFNPKRSSTFARVIAVELPTDDPKKPQKGSFTVWFKHYDRKALEAFSDKVKAEGMSDEAMLELVVTKLAGIGDGEEFSQEEQRRVIFEDMALCKLVFAEFFRGNAEAGAKN